MYRDAYQKLVEWKDSKGRKPLVLRGARQVGKTWLLQHFGEQNYKQVVYVNMEDDGDVQSIFDLDLEPARIIRAIETARKVSIDPENTLIIFDEVQAIPRALTSLKYFFEKAPQYHIAVAGSLLGIALHEGTSFPVGKVDFVDVLPMNFYEFLKANGDDGYAEGVRLNTLSAEELSAFHDILMQKLYVFMAVGGMPEAVKAYIDGAPLSKVREVQKKIVDAYELDFSKHASTTDTPKIREIFNSIPQFLARENKKFIFGAIKESARAREYESALLWIEDTGIASRVTRVNSGDSPLMAYANRNIFKLFYSDVGLLGAKMKVDPAMIVKNDPSMSLFMGAYTEQLVFQEMKSAIGDAIFYFSRDDSRGEIDFIVQDGVSVVPVEVKAGKNLSATSLKNFIDKWGVKKAIKFSELPYRRNEKIVNAPLYLAGAINKLS